MSTLFAQLAIMAITLSAQQAAPAMNLAQAKGSSSALMACEGYCIGQALFVEDEEPIMPYDPGVLNPDNPYAPWGPIDPWEPEPSPWEPWIDPIDPSVDPFPWRRDECAAQSFGTQLARLEPEPAPDPDPWGGCIPEPGPRPDPTLPEPNPEPWSGPMMLG